MEVRQIETPDEMAAVIEMAATFVAESCYAGMEFSPESTSSAVAGYMTDPDGLAAIVVDGDEILGVILGTITTPDFSDDLMAMEKHLFVRPTGRGSMAAKHLVKFFTDWARMFPVKGIFISVSSGIRPDRTARFLSKLGYKNIGNNMMFQGFDDG